MTPCAEPIMWEGRLYRSVEHAYQAAKYTDPAKIEGVRDAATSGDAKRLGQEWPTETPNWPSYRVQVMWALCVQKWTMPKHKEALLSHAEPIVEFNNWEDDFWGVVLKPTGEVLGGQNYLGRIITEIRRQLISDPGSTPRITPEFVLQPGSIQPESH